MTTIIRPKDFLIQLKNNRMAITKVATSDLLEITELGVTFPLAQTLNLSEFYHSLKKAVSDFNSDAALNGNSPIDFDDLHTKYSEYIEALKLYLQESDTT